jgi:hypothetical protein
MREHAHAMSVRIWQLVVALASVFGVIALPWSVGLAGATSSVSPNCAQRAAPLALVTVATTSRACPVVRRASTVLGETARPQRPGSTNERHSPTARTCERGQPFERGANGQLIRQTSAQRDDRYEWDVLGQLI